ncbi:hypothetical protein K445DRAFT_85014 [Daldinia sp. EC12]|nr:hypothetical protein K445DRAFT_85014 [Daldinia sp. EC12]
MRLPPIAVLTSRSGEHHNKGRTIVSPEVAVAALLASLVTITLAIRLYTRRWLTRGFGLDDIFIALAYFPTITFTIIGIIINNKSGPNHQNGNGHSGPNLDDIEIVFANQIVFEVATSLTKLSILTLLYRLTTASRDRNVTIAVLISIGAISVNCVVFIIVSSLQCIPLPDHGGMSGRSQHCIDWNIHMLAASIINTVTDWVVVLLPIRMALGLNLPVKQVGMVIFLFGLSILACSAGIVRSHFAWDLAFHPDNDGDRQSAWFVSTIELNVGIICASIPAIRPFFTSYLPGILRSLRQRNSIIPGDRISSTTDEQSFRTFIDQSSSSSSFLLRRLTPLPSDDQHTNIDKPLPATLPHRHTNLEMQTEPEAVLNPPYHSPQTPPRSYYRDDISPSNLQPRDWISIMYQEDTDPTPLQHVPNRAELP